MADFQTVIDPFKGLDLRSSPGEVKPNQARRLLNMVLLERGGAVKRLGSEARATIGTTGDRILNLHTFEREGVAPELIIHLSDGTIRTSTDLSSFTTRASSKSTTAPYMFETFNNKVYMTNGVNDYASWNGTTFTDHTTLPKGTFLKSWKDAMWVGGVTGALDTIHISAAGNAESFPGPNTVIIGRGDGKPNVTLWPDGETLIVFQRDGIYAIYDPVDYFNRLVDAEKGCESRFGVVETEGAIFFLSRHGVCIYNGDQNSIKISEDIDPLFDSKILNFQHLDKSYAYRIGNQVGWSVPEVGQTTPNLQIEMYPYYEGRPFTVHRMPMRCATIWRKDTEERLLYGRRDANKLLEAFRTIGTDDGTSFSGLYETGFTDMEAPMLNKYLRWMRVYGRGKFFVNIKRDYEVGLSSSTFVDYSAVPDTWGDGLWGSGVWGPNSVYMEKGFHPDVYGYSFAFQFTDAETTVSTREVDVGGTTVLREAGQFGVYSLNAHSIRMGDRA